MHQGSSVAKPLPATVTGRTGTTASLPGVGAVRVVFVGGGQGLAAAAPWCMRSSANELAEYSLASDKKNSYF